MLASPPSSSGPSPSHAFDAATPTPVSHQPMVLMGHPRLHLNTMLAMEDGYMRSPTSHNSSNSTFVTTPRSSNSNNIMNMSPACNFEAFSLHFHLPLKTAAEKFGVRATAFKKRCRAIGIRHWPYRKVRSLKRSLQELSRCKDQGALNDKQQHQLAAFKKQLDKLMAPETYGIDPSGRIPHEHFEDSEDESDDDDSSTQSPRYGATLMDCSISPTEGDKTFGDFSSTPAHLRTFRNKHSQYMQAAHFAKSMNQHFHSPEIHTSLHRLQQQQTPTKDSLNHLYAKFPYGMYEPYAAHESVDHKGKAMMMQNPHHHAHGASSSDESEDMSDHPSSGCVLDHQASHHSHHRHHYRLPQQSHNLHQQLDHQGDFLPTATVEMKYEDVRAFNEVDDEFTDRTSHMDCTSDQFFDDVFLHISPDYGCLV